MSSDVTKEAVYLSEMVSPLLTGANMSFFVFPVPPSILPSESTSPVKKSLMTTFTPPTPLPTNLASCALTLTVNFVGTAKTSDANIKTINVARTMLLFNIPTPPCLFRACLADSNVVILNYIFPVSKSFDRAFKDEAPQRG